MLGVSEVSHAPKLDPRAKRATRQKRTKRSDCCATPGAPFDCFLLNLFQLVLTSVRDFQGVRVSTKALALKSAPAAHEALFGLLVTLFRRSAFHESNNLVPLLGRACEGASFHSKMARRTFRSSLRSNSPSEKRFDRGAQARWVIVSGRCASRNSRGQCRRTTRHTCTALLVEAKQSGAMHPEQSLDEVGSGRERRSSNKTSCGRIGRRSTRPPSHATSRFVQRAPARAHLSCAESDIFGVPHRSLKKRSEEVHRPISPSPPQGPECRVVQGTR